MAIRRVEDHLVQHATEGERQSTQDTQDRYAEAPAWRALGNVRRDQARRSDASDAYARAQRLFEALNLTSEAGAVAAARRALTG
jgi:cytochrome c-type biogenesis protein CcmH/NrfG